MDLEDSKMNEASVPSACVEADSGFNSTTRYSAKEEQDGKNTLSRRSRHASTRATVLGDTSWSAPPQL